MALTIRGFIQIPTNANNTANAVAGLGELSDKAYTYSRNKQFVSDPDNAPDIDLVVFNAVNESDAAVNGLDTADVAPGLKLINDIHDNFDNSGSLTDWLTANADASLSNFSHGNIIVEGGINMPNYIEFTHTDADTTTYKLWISDATFLTDYDLSETVIVPAILPVTDLYADYTTVQASLANWSKIDEINALQAATDSTKYTEVTTYELKWNEPTNLSNQIQTTWMVLGYGPDGTRTDRVLEAIRNYLTANSSYTVDQWKEYLPDIQTLDVYNFIPLWENTALAAGPGIDSLQRPVFKQSSLANIMTQVLVGRDAADWTDFGESLVALFRNMPILMIAGEANDPARNSFEASFPDYTMVALNDQSANRISGATQDAISALDSLLRAAEIDDGTQTLPSGMTRNQVASRRFLERSVGGIVFRLVTKSSFEEVT
ncbi:hypothetical protein [Vibrio phage vB_VmeM-Yong XC32]|nr:hypothetical protein [Vibrio phage vB_VmeM-Yong XC31]QAX96473.1 hypothetical protein [Vibrio phage vB_VmeM-Yong XC32]QAX96790.1 hypothetical protein [Vibrio phage vB_VmeM-Yong MS31]QAX97109.1 hypothetical protein [Vibrio phage vB_VmeM-Yong MS32]